MREQAGAVELQQHAQASGRGCPQGSGVVVREDRRCRKSGGVNGYFVERPVPELAAARDVMPNAQRLGVRRTGAVCNRPSDINAVDVELDCYSALCGDGMMVGGIGNGVFANKDVGENKTVTVSGYTVSGADAGNYNLMQPAGVVASITPVPAGGILPAVAQAITALPGGSNLISAFNSAVSIVATSVVNPVILLLNTPTSLPPAATPAIQTGGSKSTDNKAAADKKESTPVQVRNEVQVDRSRVEQRGGFTILGGGMKLPGDI